MNIGDLEELMQLARHAPERRTEVPPFFAQRITANWLSSVRERTSSLWERFAIRGAAISAAALLIVLGSAELLSDSSDDADADEAAELFNLP